MTLAILLSLSFLAKAQSYVEQPEGCFSKKAFPCAIRSVKDSTDLSFGGNLLQLEQTSSIVILEPAKIKVLGGDVWVQKSDQLSVQQGLWNFKISGDFWIERDEADKILLRNLNGEVAVTSTKAAGKSPVAQPLPVGFENWYGSMSSEGQAQQGLIRAIDKASFFVRWNKFVKLARKDREQLLKKYTEMWAGSVESSAKLYSEITERRAIASQEEQNEAARRKHLQQKLEAEMRAMFRQRFYNPDLTP